MQFGGDIRIQKGKQTKWYFLNSRNAINGKAVVIKVISELSVNIRNSALIQFKKICVALEIEYKVLQ